jgi:hypothetical protein
MPTELMVLATRLVSAYLHEVTAVPTVRWQAPGAGGRGKGFKDYYFDFLGGAPGDPPKESSGMGPWTLRGEIIV